MFALTNRELRVELLDPVAEAARLGSRYCWGGYVWQVHDRVAGPLLSGPEWPNPEPAPFNGQGLPESFRHHTLDGQPLTWRAEQGVALGAGALRFDAAGNVILTAPCRWTVRSHADRVVFATRRDGADSDFPYALTRTVALSGRAVCSHTRLTNLARNARLTLEWFAHPFFALVEGAVHAELPAGTMLPDNAGFALNARMLTQRRRFLRQDDGHMDRGLQLPAGAALVATLAHPALEHVEFETDFAPSSCVIWGNDRTFSFEPYLTLDLGPGETREWSLCFRFGPCSASIVGAA